jgi:hypothetical protein
VQSDCASCDNDEESLDLRRSLFEAIATDQLNWFGEAECSDYRCW